MSEHPACDHKFTYLREERQGDGERFPKTTYYDVFVCERCLAYRRVVARKKDYDDTITYRRGENVE